MTNEKQINKMTTNKKITKTICTEFDATAGTNTKMSIELLPKTIEQLTDLVALKLSITIPKLVHEDSAEAKFTIEPNNETILTDIQVEMCVLKELYLLMQQFIN